MIRKGMIRTLQTVLFCFGLSAAALAAEGEQETAGETAQASDEVQEAVTDYIAEVEEEIIDWKTFIVENPDEYVTLGEYKGLDVEKPLYTVTDEDVDIEVDNRLYESSTMEDTGKPAQAGDTVTADISYTVDGETASEKAYPVDLGYEQFGPEFDSRLTGCKPGDTLTFTVTFDKSYETEEWAGKTVDFEVAVSSVQSLVQPELTDEWVKENSDFEDTQSYKDWLRSWLQEESDRQSTETAAETAFQAAMDKAEFKGYPEELYEVVHSQVGSQFEMFADMFGITMDELLQTYGMTGEDLENETLTQVNSYLFMAALAKAEGIEVTDQDVTDFAESSFSSYGYENAQELISASDPDELKLAVLNHKISHFLLDNSNVTETQKDYSESDLIYEDSSALDMYDEDYDEWDEDYEDYEDYEDAEYYEDYEDAEYYEGEE